MATTIKRKTTTRAVAKRQAAFVERPVENSEEMIEKDVSTNEQEQPIRVPEKKVFQPTDGILCRSVTVGRLWLKGRRSGELYNWVAYGDTLEVEYRDLVTLIRSKSSYIYNPYFVIEDEDFLAEFPEVEKFYNDQYSIKELMEIFDLPISQMVEVIQTLPKGANTTLRSLASTMVTNGGIDSVQRIRALDEVFGTELHLLSSLMN